MNSWAAKEVDARIAAVDKMASRSRYVLIVASVMSASFVLVEFNSYVSWHRRLAIENAGAKDTLKKAMVDKWVDSVSYSPSLLGVRVHSSDIPALASVALVFVSIWMFFCARRENHAVGELLGRTTRLKAMQLRSYVLHGLNDAMVFSVSTKSDAPFERAGIRAQGKPARFTRYASTWMALIPFAGLAVAAALDATSLARRSVVSGQLVWSIVAHDRSRLTHLIVAYAIVGIALVVLWKQGVATRRFWSAISDMLSVEREQIDSTGWNDSDFDDPSPPSPPEPRELTAAARWPEHLVPALRIVIRNKLQAGEAVDGAAEAPGAAGEAEEDILREALAELEQAEARRKR